jgi:hypothetical protein
MAGLQSVISDKLPLIRAVIEPEIFPFQALGAIMCPAVLELADALQVPYELAAQSALASAGFLCQSQYDVKVSGRTSPTSIFCASVSPSGGGKSSSEKAVMSAIRLHESRRLDIDAVNRQTKVVDGRSSWSRPNEPRSQPLRLLQDVTFEGLVRYLEFGEPSVLQTSDESAEFFGGWAMLKENQSRTAAGYCRLWEANSLIKSRKGDGTSRIDGKRLSVNFLMQDTVASGFLGNASLTDQGWLARFLCCKPVVLIGRRKYVGTDPTELPAVKKLHLRHWELLERPLKLDPEVPLKLKPDLLTFEPEAESFFEDIFDHFEKNQQPGGIYESVRSFASKGIVHTARIAAVIHHMNSNTLVIDLQTLKDAFMLSRWYAREAARIWGESITPPHLTDAQSLLDWIERRKLKSVELREIYQKGPSQLRTARYAEFIARILEEHGYLEALSSNDSQERRRKIWRVR